MDKAYQDKHNNALDMLQDYKSYLEKQVQNLKKLDEQSEFMKSWNENTIKDRLEEIAVIDKILKSLIRFQAQKHGCSDTLEPQNCDPSYPDFCIPSPPPDLDCGDITHKNFEVLQPDPHRFDGDYDGIGCES